ncbi:MAG TPA: GvpL/GvpF family gas vesicle protein [Gemmatimonadaceae bacterium]|nr:GvpL/GvpF family gas vesicle protein [Gemmatimonadaceae bacterium]
MGEQVIYVYGIVPAGADVSNAPPGIDGARVELEREGDVAALISALDAMTYGSDAVEASSGDVEWVGPRAIAHDAVLTWASDTGPVVPLPMFTFFHDPRGVDAMLSGRAAELRTSLERVASAQEFGVRVFRIDPELAAHIAELSPAVAELEESARRASPGQRYLLERKAENERTAEMRRVASDVARAVYHDLESCALQSVSEALPAQENRKGVGTAVLNAYFLVRRDGLEAFRATLTSLAERYEPRGFRFDFTGPWPPYHFAGART